VILRSICATQIRVGTRARVTGRKEDTRACADQALQVSKCYLICSAQAVLFVYFSNLISLYSLYHCESEEMSA
jgi:hypothetical protein